MDQQQDHQLHREAQQAQDQERHRARALGAPAMTEGGCSVLGQWNAESTSPDAGEMTRDERYNLSSGVPE